LDTDPPPPSAAVDAEAADRPAVVRAAAEGLPEDTVLSGAEVCPAPGRSEAGGW
jgi:hypothetical protein